MDSISVKALSFIFFPESHLSWFFVVIFIICFVYGLRQRSECVKKIDNFSEDGYRHSNKTISPEQYVEDFDSKLCVDDIKIIDLPNVFVSVGIIGTFLGLGVGLQGATDLLGSEKIDIRQLNDVLGVLAFKFQTSVWGTLFSLLFQKVVLEPYYKIREDKLSFVRNSLSSYAIQCSVEKNLNDISNHLTEHCRGIADNYSRFVDISGTFGDNVTECTHIMEQYKNELTHAQYDLCRYYDKHSKALDKFAVKTDETAESIIVAFKNSSNKFVSEVGNKLSENVKGNLGTVHYEYMKETETINRTISELNEALKTFRMVSKQLGEDNTATRENLTECKELLTSYSEKISTAIGSVNTMAENVLQIGMSQQENLNKTLGDVVGQVTPLFEKISAEYGQSVGKFDDMQKTFNDFVRGWKNQEILQQRELKGIVQELKQEQGDKLSTISRDLQKLSERKGLTDGEQQLLQKMQSIIDNQEKQLEEKTTLGNRLENLSITLENLRLMSEQIGKTEPGKEQ